MLGLFVLFFVFKQKTAYEMRISDWSSECALPISIVADAEAGFGGVLNAFELMKNMITAGAAGVHFEDQLAAVKKCGHMGGKVLVPTSEACEKLTAARFASDVMGVPTIVLARRSEEHTSELQSLMRISYAVFCLKKKNTHHTT